jgi:hypothetical protein
LPQEKKPPKESELIPETRTTFLSNRRYNVNPTNLQDRILFIRQQRESRSMIKEVEAELQDLSLCLSLSLSSPIDGKRITTIT